jgi:hypothetical protein
MSRVVPEYRCRTILSKSLPTLAVLTFSKWVHHLPADLSSSSFDAASTNKVLFIDLFTGRSISGHLVCAFFQISDASDVLELHTNLPVKITRPNTADRTELHDAELRELHWFYWNPFVLSRYRYLSRDIIQRMAQIKIYGNSIKKLTSNLWLLAEKCPSLGFPYRAGRRRESRRRAQLRMCVLTTIDFFMECDRQQTFLRVLRETVIIWRRGNLRDLSYVQALLPLRRTSRWTSKKTALWRSQPNVFFINLGSPGSMDRPTKWQASTTSCAFLRRSKTLSRCALALVSTSV